MTTLKIYDNVKVKIAKSPMTNKLVEMTLTVCGIELDENNQPFYKGWTETGKVRYFTEANIIG